MIVGLTGGIGSGKSTACEQFRALGIEVISADSISEKLVDKNSPVLDELITYFGREYLDEDGNLNRRKLRDRIFSNIDDKEWLESLLHPLIRIEIAKQAQPLDGLYCVVEIPLLIESNLQSAVDRILIIDCKEELQVKRAAKRDEVSPSSISSIMNQQVKRNQRLELGDDVIINNGSMKELQDAINTQHEHYLALAKAE